MPASQILIKTIGAYEPLGLTPPKAALASLTEWHRLMDWLHGTPTEADLAALTFEQRTDLIERTAGRVVAREEVFRQVNERHDPAICNPGVQALYRDADRVLGKLSERYNTATAVITEGLGYFTADEFADSAALFARGREAAATAYSVRDATAELELIRDLVEQLLGTVGEHSARAIAVWVNLTAEAADDTFAKALASFRGPNRWPALFAVPGVVPELHTAEQAAAIVARTKAERLAAEEAAQAERERKQQEHKAQLRRDRGVDEARVVKLS